jgi:hypothetical protein
MAKTPWDPTTAKLNQAAKKTKKPPGAKRTFLNKTGSHTRNMTSNGDKDRMQKYAVKRQLAVGKIMTIGELMRDAGAFDRDGQGNQVRVSTEGAFWQTYQGTKSQPACHTAPALLMFDRHLPTILPEWAKLKNKHAIAKFIVMTFAECISMPLFINKIDQALDENFGGKALIRSMKLIMAGTDALEATIEYQEQMLKTYNDLYLKSPVELAYELGRLQPNAKPVTRESLLIRDPSWRLEEVAIVDRLDDPNHQMLDILTKINSHEPSREELVQFREKIEREMA